MSPWAAYYSAMPGERPALRPGVPGRALGVFLSAIALMGFSSGGVSVLRNRIGGDPPLLDDCLATPCCGTVSEKLTPWDTQSRQPDFTLRANACAKVAPL